MVLVECYHCGNRFRFDETQIIKATMYRCPDCGTQLLISAMTEQGETRYETSPPASRASARGAQAFGLTLADMKAQGPAPTPQPATPSKPVKNPYEAVQQMKARAAAQQPQAQAPAVGITLADMPAFNPDAAAKPAAPTQAQSKPVKNPYEAVQQMKAKAAAQKQQPEAPAVGITLADMPAFNPDGPAQPTAPATPKPSKPKKTPQRRPGHVYRPPVGEAPVAAGTPKPASTAPGILSANRTQAGPPSEYKEKKSINWFWVLVWGAAIVVGLVSLGVIDL